MNFDEIQVDKDVTYSSKTFNSFKDLQLTHTLNYERIRAIENYFNQHLGNSWKNKQIVVYPSQEQYAIYVLFGGAFKKSDLVNKLKKTKLIDSQLNADTIVNYIDYELLGRLLTENWDNDTHYTYRSGSIYPVISIVM